LAANGFQIIYRWTGEGNWQVDLNEDDIIQFSWGRDMSTSGGAGGHVGVIHDSSETFESTDYWTDGALNTAISRHDASEYINRAIANGLGYFEVWRDPKKAQINNPLTTGYVGDEDEDMQLVRVNTSVDIWEFSPNAVVRLIPDEFQVEQMAYKVITVTEKQFRAKMYKETDKLNKAFPNGYRHDGKKDPAIKKWLSI
jgi:hypothetical protein